MCCVWCLLFTRGVCRVWCLLFTRREDNTCMQLKPLGACACTQKRTKITRTVKCHSPKIVIGEGAADANHLNTCIVCIHTYVYI
jgi:hypothetical protein